jgi:hypothetical protein
MANKLKWNEPKVRRRIEEEVGRRLDACGIIVTNHVKELLSVEGSAKSPGKRGKLIFGANPSRPGEPPHVQSGRLRASMAWERNGLVLRIGTNVRYARALEQGRPPFLLPRPYLLRALNEKRAQIERILSRPMVL